MAVTTRPQPATSDNWHIRTPHEVMQALDVDSAAGLRDTQVAERLEKYGKNELVERGGKSPLAILYEQLTNPLVLLLIGAALVSGLLGKWDSFIAISAIVVLNAVLGVVQEYRAEQAMAALRQMAAPLVRVRRMAKVLDVEASQLVPGDVVLLEAGSVVPADSRLHEAANLRVQEASLTGESQPVEKEANSILPVDAPIGDRSNMVYMGTSVTYGRGSAIVVATGMETQLGHIADLIQTVDSGKTPLQRRLEELGKVLLASAVVVMVIAFVIGLIAGVPIVPPADDPKAESVLLNAVAIAVAVVPEGLPAVVTIALALGAQRMLRRRALIRKLSAVETLGSVTVICSDKTGTLTENRMTVTVIDVAGATDTLEQIVSAKESGAKTEDIITNAQLITLIGDALCNDAVLQETENGTLAAIGDPTEGSLVIAAAKYGIPQNRLMQTMPRVAEVPFEADRKRMSTVHDVNEALAQTPEEKHLLALLNVPAGSSVVFTKGAVDSLLTVAGYAWLNDQVVPMTPEINARVTDKNNDLAKNGLRVLGLAYRIVASLPEKATVESVEQDLIFVGMVGIIDPPRQEVKDAVQVCRTAGIRPVMITGDHPMTAFAIARQLGIARDGDRVITGHDLSAMTPEQLKQTVRDVSVYARVSPEHKLNIVQALQENGEVAAMTGDGVNDAPALKRANIGVAMGITGTAVSKEASDMVLLDDNFTTIVAAVEEGRTIYDNVRRFIKYLLASNSGELIVLLASQLVAGMSLPLTTLQILWMNLITDGIPALALGVEGAERGAMERAPYAPNESLFGRGLWRHIVIVGAVMGITGLALGVWAFNSYTAEASNILSISTDQLIEAENSQIHFTDAAEVATEATRIGISPEQLTQIHEGVPTQTFHRNTWNTMVFMFLTIAQMGHALALRSHRNSIFSLNFFSNKLLIGAVVVTVVLQLVAVYLPFFNQVFNTTPLSAAQLALCLVLSTVVFIAAEIEKLLIRRGVLS